MDNRSDEEIIAEMTGVAARTFTERRSTRYAAKPLGDQWQVIDTNTGWQSLGPILRESDARRAADRLNRKENAWH